MTKILYFLAIALLLPLGTARAEGRANFISPVEAEQWVMSYYRHPMPGRVVNSLRALSAAGNLKEEFSKSMLIGFLAGVLAAHPDSADALAAEWIELPSDEQGVVVFGIWYSGLPNAGLLLKRVADRAPGYANDIDLRLSAKAATPLVELPMERLPWALDALWGSFFATGSAVPVRRVMSLLPWVNLPDDAARRDAGEAARRSLIANAVRDPLVLAICRAELNAGPPEMQAQVSKVVADTEAWLARHKAAKH